MLCICKKNLIADFSFVKFFPFRKLIKRSFLGVGRKWEINECLSHCSAPQKKTEIIWKFSTRSANSRISRRRRKKFSIVFILNFGLWFWVKLNFFFFLSSSKWKRSFHFMKANALESRKCNEMKLKLFLISRSFATRLLFATNG